VAPPHHTDGMRSAHATSMSHLFPVAQRHERWPAYEASSSVGSYMSGWRAWGCNLYLTAKGHPVECTDDQIYCLISPFWRSIGVITVGGRVVDCHTATGLPGSTNHHQTVRSSRVTRWAFRSANDCVLFHFNPILRSWHAKKLNDQSTCRHLETLDYVHFRSTMLIDACHSQK